VSYKNSPAFKYINFGISFGLTLAITVYLLYRGGIWLDNKLGTAPVFMFCGILLAIASVFRRLIADLRTLDKKPDDEGK